MPNGPADERTESLVIQRRVDRRVAARLRLDVRQQLHAEIRREDHRHDPRRDQREADDPEDVAGVLTRGRSREANRHQADDGDERAGQHRRGGVAPGVRRGFAPLEALLELHHHHLDGDDRVVDEKTERKDERAQGDAIELAVRGQHDHENGRKRQRDRGGDHDATTPAEAREADDHHDRQRDEKFQHELVDRLADVDRLIRHLGEAQACRKFCSELLLFSVERLTELEAVPAILHHDAEYHGRVAVVADQKGRRILIPSLYLGDIGQLEHAAPGCNRRVA